VETSGSRTRLNLMGAINLTALDKTVIREYDKINSHNIARFFIAIREHTRYSKNSTSFLTARATIAANR
jgi:hypothetical protein